MRVMERDGKLFHPVTGEKLPPVGTEGYHGFKHFWERYPFREVERMWKMEKNKRGRFTRGQEIPEHEWGRFFEHKNHGYYIPEPSLREIFGDHPQIQPAAQTLEAALRDPSAPGRTQQRRYVEFINAILAAFEPQRETGTA